MVVVTETAYWFTEQQRKIIPDVSQRFDGCCFFYVCVFVLSPAEVAVPAGLLDERLLHGPHVHRVADDQRGIAEIPEPD